MKFYTECDFSDFKPWSGAVDTFNRIIDEGKADEAERYFEEIEPADGWTDTGINDMLWFESDAIYKALGMKPDDTTTRDAADILEAWENENRNYNYKPIRLEWDADTVTVVYIDEDDADEDENGERIEPEEQTEDLDAEEVAELFGDDCGEIDENAHTVETWERD